MSETFQLRQEHIQMLQAGTWREAPSGEPVPMMDDKRPFGFSGGIIESAAEKIEGYDPSALTGYERELLEQCFDELPTAITVVLEAETFESGVYQKRDGVWTRKD